MKHKLILKLSLLTVSSIIPCATFAESNEGITSNTDKVIHAVGVLKGIYQDSSKEDAVRILNDAVSKDSMVYAMNALGLIYMEGIGTAQDTTKAIQLLDEAGEKGFPNAYHNLGAVYKEGKCGIRQNYSKAFETFMKGAKKGSDMCKYDAGFMLYKGLGCQQDYEEAVLLFTSASDGGHKGATYMLGLCYRNGYGVEQDEEQGMKLLKQASDLGYRAAIEEMERPLPENCMHDIIVNNTSYGEIPENMPDIKTDVNNTSLLNGQYQGFIVMYDWSGKHILGERPVTMSLTSDAKKADGYLKLGNDSIPFTATVKADGSLKFNKSYTKMNERYTYTGKETYRLDKAQLDIWEKKICGSLSLYSVKHREPEKPMYMELYRAASSKEIAVTKERISVSPNPFSTEFRATFRLASSGSVVVRIFDKYGIKVWQKEIDNLSEGTNTLTFSPNIPAGYYVLNISAGNQTLRLIIVKNDRI